MTSNKHEWEYRVVRRESKDGSDEWYSIQEVYFDDKNKPYAYTIDLQVENDTITGMKTQLEKMLEALENPVLDEQDIVGEDNLNKEYDGDYEQLEHEGNIAYRNTKTGELRNMFGDKIDNPTYIYESPDGGQTIYRREMGENKREKV
tara:strand:- start:176 stop:616 length:441 start_codon:yes stop_codon:yes gene_type:complete